MSDDKKVVDIFTKNKTKTEDAVAGADDYTKTIVETFKSIIQPGDYAGFMRIVEALRIIGDVIEITATPGGVGIVTTQFPEEPLEVKEGITRAIKISQSTYDANNKPYHQLKSDTYTFEDHIKHTSTDMSDMVDSLIDIE